MEVTRQEKIVIAMALRNEGLIQREIAKRMGISTSYVSELLSDPDRSKVLARRERYRKPCVDCGKPTTGAGGFANQSMRCRICAAAQLQVDALWTQEALIRSIQLWNEIYGRQPSAVEWNPSLAKRIGRQDWVDRFYADACWPLTNSVVKKFGSWNAGIVAAGFTPRPVGRRGDPQPPAFSIIERGRV